MDNRQSKHQQPGAPPWLWFWIVAFVLYSTRHYALTQNTWLTLQSARESAPELAKSFPEFRLSFLLYPGYLLELLPVVALAIGCVFVLLPWVRCAWIEWSHSLRAHGNGNGNVLPALHEIEAFIQEISPNLEVRANPIRTDQFAFVYSNGFRRPRVGISGGFLQLWRKNQRCAESILHHEISHVRRGEHLVAGVGSLLSGIASFTIMFYLLLFILPLLIVMGYGRFSSYREMSALQHQFTQELEDQRRQLDELTARMSDEERKQLGDIMKVNPPVESPSILAHQLSQTMTVIGQLGPITLGAIFYLLASWVTLIGALWAAELNADRTALQMGTDGGETYEQTLGMHQARSWWRWLFSGLSHPPMFFRKWSARHSQSASGLIVLLTIFPIAYLISLLCLHAHARLNIGVDYGLVQIAENSRLWLSGRASVFLGIGAVLSFWPFMWRWWEGLFIATTRPSGQWRLKEYAATGAGMMAFGVCGFFLDSPSLDGPAAVPPPPIEPRVEYPNITGAWSSDWGEVNLQSNDDGSVSGTYATGSLEGSFQSSHQLVLKWIDNSGASGLAEFSISEDVLQLDGTWGTGSSKVSGGSWNLSRLTNPD